MYKHPTNKSQKRLPTNHLLSPLNFTYSTTHINLFSWRWSYLFWSCNYNEIDCENQFILLKGVAGFLCFASPMVKIKMVVAMAMAMCHTRGYKSLYEWLAEPNFGRLWLLLMHALMVSRL